MDAKEFRKKVQNVDNKIEFLKENSKDFKFSIQELVNAIKDVFSDQEKVEFLGRYNINKNLKKEIMKSIENDELKLGLFENKVATDEFIEYDYREVIKSLKDDGKIKVLYNEEIIEKYKFSNYDVTQLILSMEDESKKKCLNSKGLLEKTHLNQSNIAEIINSMSENEKKEILNNPDKARYLWDLNERNFSTIIDSLKDEDERLDYIDKCELNNTAVICDVVEKLSDKRKLETLLSEKYDFYNYQTCTILANFQIDNLFKVLEEQKEFFEKNEISVFEITKKLSKDKQLEFLSRMEEIELSKDEKRKIFATLKKETKNEIDKAIIPEECICAFNMEISDDFGNIQSYGKIIFDVDKDIEEYRGLDELIFIKPQDIELKHSGKLKQLAQICPQIEFTDNIDLAHSTSQEFLNAEEWIDEVIGEMDSDWTDIQKLAYIDNKVGKKIGYTPDFDTEVSEDAEARALWKIIDSGYGVCNGIAQVEQYILKKVGIETEMVSSGTHSFLRVKNIEIPREDGTTIATDVIQDPTWNLTAHQFGGFPNNFCKSYEEIRKHDILSDGTDKACHKNDEKLSNVNVGIEEKVLRDVFHSIGIADKEGEFPIGKMLDESNKIATEKISLEEKVKKQLGLLKQTNPNFEKFKNETMSILAGNLLDHDEMAFERCVVNRVFDKRDTEKNPVVFVYCDMPMEGKKFFVARDGDFVEMKKDEFVNNYECYSMDLEKNNGLPHWESKEVEKDLNKSSGNLVADREEGDER